MTNRDWQGNDPSLGGRQQDVISAKLTGANGFGDDTFKDDDVEGLQHALQDLHARVSNGSMSRSDAAMVMGIRRHIDAGSFMQTAYRRARLWRFVAALADRVIEFEGIARIHFESAEYGGQLALQLAFAVADKEDGLILLQSFANKHNLTATQRVIGIARDFLCQVAEDTMQRYWSDVGKRSVGGHRE